MNYKDCCRTCLGKSEELRPVNAVISIGGNSVCLADILYDFYRIKISEDNEAYPKNICIHCAHHLTVSYSFRIVVENCNKSLLESIVSIKNDFDCDNADDEMNTSDIEYKPEVKHNPEKIKIKFMKKGTRRRQVPDVGDRKDYFCVECRKQFTSKESLREHCAVHPVKCTVGRDCEFCFEKFEDFKSLVMHRKLHSQPYLCITCWNGFYTDKEMEAHTCQPYLQKKNRKDEKKLCQCDQCGKSYPKSYIKVHMMTHSDELKYSCKYCPKKFKVANCLNSHVLWNHKRTRDHKCEVCDATFISASAKSSHIRKNHLQEKKYICETCKKRFFSKSELQRHILTHTGLKNFHCDLCDKSYQTRYGLNVHLKSHMPVINSVMNLQ